jgi:EAL domain-containing protein (putative c-di-GMP-specific phosphodiesterase class I)
MESHVKKDCVKHFTPNILKVNVNAFREVSDDTNKTQTIRGILNLPLAIGLLTG